MTRTTPETLAGRAEREPKPKGYDVAPDGTITVHGVCGDGRLVNLRAALDERLRLGPPPPTEARRAVLGRILPPGTYATPDDGDVVTFGRTE